MKYLWIIARNSYLNFDENMTWSDPRTELFWTIHFISIYCRWMTIRDYRCIISWYWINGNPHQLEYFRKFQRESQPGIVQSDYQFSTLLVAIKYVTMQICLPVVFYDFTWLSCPHNSLTRLSKTIYWSYEIKDR